MKRRDDIGIIVLAAGEASRYGAVKLALPIAGVAMVRRAAMAAVQASEKVVVVTGCQHEVIAPLVADLDVAITRNADWASGMGGSIAHAVARLGELAPNLAGAIIALADQVGVGTGEFVELMSAHSRLPRHIIAARYADRQGAPCLFPSSYFVELSRMHGATGAHALLERHSDRVHAIAMPEAAVDVDTPADYARVIADQDATFR